MKKTFLAIAICGYLNTCVAAAEQLVSLQCEMKWQDGKTTSIWVAIDKDKDTMAIDGRKGELSTTNERYSVRLPPVAGFVDFFSLDRATGKISAGSFYEGEVVMKREGMCTKAEPPPTKF